jgi:hypothetical protein
MCLGAVKQFRHLREREQIELRQAFHKSIAASRHAPRR